LVAAHCKRIAQCNFRFLRAHADHCHFSTTRFSQRNAASIANKSRGLMIPCTQCAASYCFRVHLYIACFQALALSVQLCACF
jgi:hypothetical protein